MSETRENHDINETKLHYSNVRTDVLNMMT